MSTNGEMDAGLVSPDGTLLDRPEQVLTSAEVQLLRLYKKFLLSHGLSEALYCNECFRENRLHGMRAAVTDNNVLMECRCRRLTFTGITL